MWIHVVIFVMILCALTGWKKGWIPSSGIGGKDGIRLFAVVAIAGNLLGMILTLQNGGQVYPQGYRLEKEDTGSYEKEFMVSVDGEEPVSPTLEKRHQKYFLRFSYTEEVTLTKTPVKEQIICSVDLGINTDAVCTIMRADGTVLGRKFIDHPSEKDRMYRTLGRIRRFQREHGSAQTQGRWAYTKRLNTELGKKIAGAIVRYAEENHADVIVFEYLEMQGKISGKKRQKLHLWRKRDIQKCCEHQAHRKGMRVSRICAWNTSRLAYDGSGVVTRDWENHSLCTFQTGKRYNCDLSASYNIGARYFIRELLKPLPATERSLLEAKVPPVKRRTSCVYADLRKLHSEMELLKEIGRAHV